MDINGTGRCARPKSAECQSIANESDCQRGENTAVHGGFLRKFRLHKRVQSVMLNAHGAAVRSEVRG